MSRVGQRGGGNFDNLPLRSQKRSRTKCALAGPGLGDRAVARECDDDALLADFRTLARCCRQRNAVSIGTVLDQFEVESLSIDLSPEVIERHQQGGRKGIGIALDVDLRLPGYVRLAALE